MSNGSANYVIAFSTAESVRRHDGNAARTVQDLPNDAVSGLFVAVAEAIEEAVCNSLFRATTVATRRATVEALRLGRRLEIRLRHNAIR
jgi:D-aminopeptidase